jgi:outer membrane protein assembly factor BamB
MTCIVRRVPLLPILLGMLVGSATAQEWTRFRGPNGSGETEAAGIPTTWTAKDYRWRVELPGIGHSSPVVWGDRLYVTSADERNATRTVLCLKTTDGSEVWKRSFPARTHHKNKLNGYAASTPVVDQDRVYITWAGPDEYIVLALNRATGEDVWRQNLGPFEAQHGFGASAIMVDGLLIVPHEHDGKSSIVAIEGATGKTRWTAPRRTEKAGYATPMLYQPQGGSTQIILISWAHGVASIDPASGKANWELTVLKHRTVGSPIVAAGLIFAQCGEGSGGKQMFAVTPGDPAKKIEPKVAYEIKDSLPYAVTPVAYKNLVFLWNDQGVVTCLDAPTGKMLWRERVGGKYFGSPVRVGDRLYCMSCEGEMVVLAAADHYQLLGRINLEEPSQATPAVADGVMYLRTRSHLMAIGGK